MIWIVLLSLVTGVLRFAIPGHGLSWPGTYEAFAHIWVGALLVLIIVHWKQKEGKLALACLLAITVLELVMFLAR